jgi:hypothetical protein
VLVKISVNRLKSGRIQICVAKPQYNPNPVQTYPSVEEARKVLSSFGIDDKESDAILKLVPEVGPNELLKFSPMDIPQDVRGNTDSRSSSISKTEDVRSGTSGIADGCGVCLASGFSAAVSDGCPVLLSR